MESIEIVEQNVHDEKVRQGLIDFLAPHETHALFLVANLQSNLQPSFLYVARQHGRIVGVCGLYPALFIPLYVVNILGTNPNAKQ